MRILSLLISLAILGFCAPIERYEYQGVQEMELSQNEQIFRAGFEAGIKALDFQRKNDGFKPKQVNINKAYYIIYDITKMPYEEALFLQNIAAREGFDTHITKKYIYFGEFEREADAKKSLADLATKYRINAELHKNSGKDYLTTYPKLWGQYFTLFEEEIRKLGYVKRSECANLVGKDSNSTATTDNIAGNTKSNARGVASNKATAYFTLKNSRAMAYANADMTASSRQNSLEYIEIGLKRKKNYPMRNDRKPYFTKQGEAFYKVLNQNIYFSDKDVVLIGR